ncbi:hypothetical protein F441_06876 [Phytophthora nicotianae CJ01A1]|uniref:Uncharacterized protein n=1 Tax=Phytophthora nicotianae CJ01A1 TaxID=1317063 RepID=W2X9E0_PHYNI|nr:hypothetical protein F441_06876 [Phytophthora nicotianae CJ01A1]
MVDTSSIDGCPRCPSSACQLNQILIGLAEGQTITSGHAIHAERRLRQRFTFACDFSAVCHAACLAEASNRTGSPPRDLSVVLSSIKAQF